MTALQAVERLARSGADSVFCFIERRAGSVLDGVRWQTLTWENAPQSSFGVAMGSGGAPLSLADNARLRGTTRGVTLPLRRARRRAGAWRRAPRRTDDRRRSEHRR
jgi:hypothetical protein